jgi:hypothetical protein
VDDSGFSRTPDRLLMLSGSRTQQLEVVEIMTDIRGLYNLGGFVTACAWGAVRGHRRRQRVGSGPRRSTEVAWLAAPN